MCIFLGVPISSYTLIAAAHRVFTLVYAPEIVYIDSSLSVPSQNRSDSPVPFTSISDRGHENIPRMIDQVKTDSTMKSCINKYLVSFEDNFL